MAVQELTVQVTVQGEMAAVTLQRAVEHFGTFFLDESDEFLA